MDNRVILIIIIFGVLIVLSRWLSWKRWERRRDYYRNEYLKSDEWRRKRYVVLKRDNWRCVYCGAPATQVHHKKYAKRNIGKEPIDWLVSVCNTCHDSIHN
jgi:5-methylcytosine-specific restriction endonuclease McrA